MKDGMIFAFITRDWRLLFKMQAFVSRTIMDLHEQGLFNLHLANGAL